MHEKYYYFSYFIIIFFSKAKNVATDISEKLCQSVASKLEGKVLGTFTGKYESVIFYRIIIVQIRDQIHF